MGIPARLLLLLLTLLLSSLGFSCSSDAEEKEVVLDIPIDGKNDSLLGFDTVVVEVTSKDGGFTQEVYRGRLRDPRKLLGLVLDPKVGREFTVRITGYRNGQLGMHRVVAVANLRPTEVRDLPLTDTAKGPTLAITSPAGDTAVNSTLLTVHYTLAGVPLQRSYSLTEGPNPVKVDTVLLGRKLSDSITVTLDRKPPGRPVLSGPAAINVKTPTWTWRSGGEGGIGRYRYTLDDEDMGGAKPLDDTAFTPSTELAPGTRTLFLQERDLAGNWSDTARWSILIDVTAPEAPLPGTGMPEATASRRPAWSWKSGGGGNGTFRFKLDDEEMKLDATTAEHTTFTPAQDLGDGPHTLYVQERDAAGNWSALTPLPIRVDLTPPEKPAFDSTPYSPVVSPRPTWTWKSGGGGNGTYRFRLNDSDLTRGADTGTQRSFRPGSDLPEGLHTLWVQERDTVGHWSAAAASRTLMVTARARVGEVVSEGGTSSSQSSLTISSSGEPYIAYQDFGNGGSFGRFVAKRFTGSGWVQVGNSPSGAIIWWPNAFALNPAGVPHVVVADSAERGKILRFDASWSHLGMEPAFPSGMGEPALAFNKSSMPYVAFRDLGRSGKTTVIKMNESHMWDTVGSRGFSRAASTYHGLAINKQGVPIVAYLEATSDVCSLKVRKFNSGGSVWEDVGQFPARSFGNTFFSLLLDRNDTLFIALTSHESGGEGEVWKFTGSTWARVGESLYPSGSNNRIVLKEEGAGRKYAAYNDVANGGGMTLKAFIGGKWIACGPPGFTPKTQGNGPASLIFDRNGVPYLVIQDMTNGARAAVYKTGFDP